MEEYQRILDAMTAAGFSSRELGIIAETSMGTALDGVTQATEPKEQALALVKFAEQYGMLANLRRAVLYTGADRPALQNLLLGNEQMVNSTEEQRHVAANSIDIVRLENRVERLSDKLIALEHRVDTFPQRTPLNWSIVAWGIAIAIIAGSLMWIMATVK